MNVGVSLNGTMLGVVRIRRNWCILWVGSARAATSRPYNGWCKCNKAQFTTPAELSRSAYKIIYYLQISAARGYPFPISYLVSDISYLFPQGLLIVKNFSVENRRTKMLSPGPVDKLLFFTTPLWKKSQRHTPAFPTFPHNFPLLPLLLPKLIYRYRYLLLSDRKEFLYAFYL